MRSGYRGRFWSSHVATENVRAAANSSSFTFRPYPPMRSARWEGRVTVTVARMTIDELLARARQRLDRVTTEDALDAVRDGAVLVDIRSELQRAADGLMPGAIFLPRNVLEWRCDVTSGYDDPRLSGDPDRRIVLVCDEGYQSSLAAAMLQDLGLARATDLVGGFQAWAAAGLPVVRDVARV